ncbi:uncharacterized protein LOC143204119 isoform X3 [Rhynchophorus ferrugineus]|uniref:uncharacterized protein LOC143204119 isoform X3 n=1 Tax=Rhynchophorus ferrugineus TaxID=354439 RepID=UPI003FCC758D
MSNYYFSGPRMSNMGQINGNRRPNISRMSLHDNRSYHDHRQQSHHERQVSSHHDSRHSHIQQPINTQHEDLIKYISESWSKVETDRSSSTAIYYQDQENHHLQRAEIMPCETNKKPNGIFNQFLLAVIF